MRAVIYARYSSDNQREASIEDQVRICRERLEREGWKMVQVYSDRAMSGSNLLRPGIQALIEDAMNGRFDVVVAEALDRISRDQADVAMVYKRMKFADVSIVTHGGGVTFGTHKVIDGKGIFSAVRDISDLYGGYAEASAHAGAGAAVDARAMMKGNVNLSLSGTGQGINVGLAFGRFGIKPK